MAATVGMSDPLPEEKIQYIELDSSPVKTKSQPVMIDQATPQKQNFNSPVKEVENQENKSSNTSTPTKALKQKQREEERIAKQKQKELEKQERERAREADKHLREQKRLEKELERKKANEEKERIKREKREQLQREKEEKERQRLKEKEEKEKQKIEEKKKKEEERLKKEEEKLKLEGEKKKAEEEKLKKKQKLHISNFFKPKSVVKSSTVIEEPAQESSDLDYKRTFHDFYLRENVLLISPPKQIDIENFDKELQSSDSKDWKDCFQSNKEEHEIQQHPTAKYVFEHQLDSAPMNFKFIRFYENIRTYIGTYTKTPKPDLGKNPFYENETPFMDWDDEQEEDEEGEGEDIDEDDEEEDEDDDEGSEEDLSDFLEDDKTTNTKRKALGPLVPIVHWHKTSDISLSVEILKENVTSIDPSFNYWEVITPNSELTNEEPKAKKSKTLILERTDLEIFAKEVHDTDFTVPTMVELLKKKLPNYTKLTIENTLKAYAKKVGPKATEKKWEIDNEQLKKAMGVW